MSLKCIKNRLVETNRHEPNQKNIFLTHTRQSVVFPTSYFVLCSLQTVTQMILSLVSISHTKDEEKNIEK